MFAGFFCSPNNIIGMSAYRPADGNKFGDIESAFAEFEFGHEGLPLPEPFTQFNLGNTGFLPRLDKKLDHSSVQIGTK